MTDETTGLGVGARLPRKEDARFLRGRGKYVADVHVPRTMEIAFVRSPVGHGRLRAVNKPKTGTDRVFVADDLKRIRAVRIVPSKYRQS